MKIPENWHPNHLFFLTCLRKLGHLKFTGTLKRVETGIKFDIIKIHVSKAIRSHLRTSNSAYTKRPILQQTLRAGDAFNIELFLPLNSTFSICSNTYPVAFSVSNSSVTITKSSTAIFLYYLKGCGNAFQNKLQYFEWSVLHLPWKVIWTHTSW